MMLHKFNAENDQKSINYLITRLVDTRGHAFQLFDTICNHRNLSVNLPVIIESWNSWRRHCVPKDLFSSHL